MINQLNSPRRLEKCALYAAGYWPPSSWTYKSLTSLVASQFVSLFLYMSCLFPTHKQNCMHVAKTS